MEGGSDMWESFKQVIPILGSLGTILTACVLFIRPLRDRILGTKAVREGQRCVLRSDMLHTYYKHKDEGTIRQHEQENFILEYKAYKALKGNSFIDGIADKVMDWETIT